MKKNKNQILIASDHAGWDLKQKVVTEFPQYQWLDLGPFERETSVDYPDFAKLLCTQMQNHNEITKGILICGSGQGMAMVANKYAGIRAALVWNIESTTLAREHNDANVLCLGGRLLPHSLALECVKVFLNTAFAGGRHQIRVDKVNSQLTIPSK